MTRKSFPMNDLLTTHDAAVMLGMSLRSVQLFCEAGRLSCVRTPGGHRRIPKADVQALIAAGGGATETPAQLLDRLVGQLKPVLDTLPANVQQLVQQADAALHPSAHA